VREGAGTAWTGGSKAPARKARDAEIAGKIHGSLRVSAAVALPENKRLVCEFPG